MSVRRQIVMMTVAAAGLMGASCATNAVRPPAGRTFAPSPPGGLEAPGHTPASARPFTVTVPAALLGERGTIAMWFKPDATLRGASDKLSLIDGDALQTFIDPRRDAVWVLMHAGPAMTGDREGRKARFYWLGAALTHLEAERWYHAAWTWDVTDASRNGFFLDGVRQCGGRPYDDPDLFKAADRDVAITIGARGLSVSGPVLYADALSQPALEAVCRSVGHPRYTDEGVRFTGEKFVPTDVDFDHPVYATSFDDPAVLNDWRLEGGRRMGVADGKLVLESDASGTQAGSGPNHLVCWLTRKMPADFLLEFTVCPQDRKRGLNIVFFNARGVHGENIFEPPIKPRNGLFRQYHSGDIDNYHISYWSGGRGTANCRKNKGFYLVAVGKDLIGSAPQGSFQTVRIYKHGGKIRLTVDDVLALAYDDDGKTYGPVHTHAGWIGLRQMGHTLRCEYGHFKVWPLKGR